MKKLVLLAIIVAASPSYASDNCIIQLAEAEGTMQSLINISRNEQFYISLNNKTKNIVRVVDMMRKAKNKAHEVTVCLENSPEPYGGVSFGTLSQFLAIEERALSEYVKTVTMAENL